jgi:alanine dehydrogenase
VESGAGLGAGFTDLDYQKAGGCIVYSGEEVYGRGQFVLKVGRPTVEVFEWLQEGQILMGFVHLAAARRSKVELLFKRRVTTRNHVRYVVTEHGIADLYGKTIRQRARALIEVAHPQLREELEKGAREFKYL